MNKKISTTMLIFYIILEVASFFNYNFFVVFNKFNVIFSLLIFIIVYFANFKLFNKKTLLFIISLFFVLIISMFINNGTLGSVLNVVCLVLGLEVFSKIDIPQSYFKFILLLMCMLLLLYIYKSKDIFYITKYYKNTDFNSNTVAQSILYINMIVFIYFLKFKKNCYILFFTLLPISILSIISTQCRGAIISYAVFILTIIIRKYNILKNKSGLILLILSILGTIFPIFYLNLYKEGINFTLPFINKFLYTGREALWLYAYNKLTSNTFNILFGLGANFVIVGQDVLNLHNMFFALIVNFGITIYIAIMIWLCLFIKSNVMNQYKFCLIPIVLLSFFETTILWNAILIFIFVIENMISVKDNKLEEDTV